MKINPADRGAETETETDGAAEASLVDESDESADESGSESALSGEAEPLTIGLPDGSESVSEAILSHRQMLTNPSEHGLVAASEAEDVQETVAELAEEVPDDLQDELVELETSVGELAGRLDRQERQIGELRATVASLADILGASVEFQTFDDA